MKTFMNTEGNILVKEGSERTVGEKRIGLDESVQN
jgi:hypothetical protein